MKYVLILSLLLASVLSDDPSVVQLNDTSFEQYQKEHDHILIYFHAVWSNDSNFLKVQFYRLPNSIKSQKPLVFAEITSKNYITNHKYDINTYPSIVLVTKDKHFTYKGEMTTNVIGDWVERYINPYNKES